MITKNTAIWVHYRVWSTANNAFLAGDVANHTLQVIKDGVKAAASNSPQEISAGLYRVLVTADEVNGLFITLAGVSSTGSAYMIPVHMITDDTTRGQELTVQYTAWDMVANEPKTGDEANHSLIVAQANASAAANNSPSEVDSVNAPGVYSLVLDDTETAGVLESVFGTSSTSDIVIMPISFITAFQVVYPAEANVLEGIQYGADGTELTGTLQKYGVDTDPGDSIRKQILDTLITRLETILIANGYKTNLGSNVFHWLDSQITQDQLPAITVEDADEFQGDVTVGQVDHTVTVTMRISAQAKADFYNARADLIKAIGTDTTFGNLAYAQPPSEIGQVELDQKKIWTQSYQVNFEYPTDRFNPYSQ